MDAKKIKLIPAQEAFFSTGVRYPAMVSAWGTGKTMVMLLRAVKMCEYYSNNLGLIVRREFTDLRDSTIKDFGRYTGMTLNSNKDAVFSNGSILMFRHAKELAILQNVNLGFFGMEQAEEFETDDQFQMLTGRLRREGVPHSGMVIANTAGHNWIWRLWKHNPGPDYRLSEATTYDNAQNLPADYIRDLETRLKVESPRKFERFVMNSWEEYELEASYYAALMSDALKEGRCELSVLFDPTSAVYTFWDLGIRASDVTAIWFVQFVRDEIWLIDYYENYSEGMEHYAKVLQDKGYLYGIHYLPHDATNRQQGEITETRQQILARLLPNQKVLIVPHKSSVEVRISTTREVLPRCKFSQLCRTGVEALIHYSKKKNLMLSTEAQPVFFPEPLHDWASNAADAFGYMAITVQYGRVEGRYIGTVQRLSSPGVVVNRDRIWGN